MYRFNIRGNSLCITKSCDTSENRTRTPEISVEEKIRIYGGEVVYSDKKPEGTYNWEFNADFRTDIEKMWALCRKDTKYWNNQIGIIASEIEKSKTGTSKFKSYKTPDESFLKSLLRFGLIKAYRIGNDDFDIVYKNEQVKRCLTKAGQILEMKVCVAAMDCVDNNGKNVYNNVVNGVYIDWDGKLSSERGGYDTENEIDVMMMKGAVPVFVSCKNGFVDIDELYKLSTVAHRFGAQYAKKVLIATSLEKSGEFAKYFRERAKDMNIHLVENVCDCSDSKLERIMAGLWER